MSSYIVEDKIELKNLFEQSPSGVQQLVKGGEAKKTATTLGQKYTLWG